MSYVILVIERSFYDGQGTVETNERTMEKDRKAFTKAETEQERRQALGRQSQGFRGYSLDSSNRSALGGFAKTISKSLNLLAKTQTLGRTRYLAASLASVPLGA